MIRFAKELVRRCSAHLVLIAPLLLAVVIAA